ncbi:MAG: CARDB domain-containing protein, partial [Candidatus Cloacimonadaceae bacterium]
MKAFIYISVIMLLFTGFLIADVLDEASAIKAMLNMPFSAKKLEVERDNILVEITNPVKGEFETSAQFEQRKQDGAARKAAIGRDYAQRIQDARVAHEEAKRKLNTRLNELLAASRESVKQDFTLIGNYDADKQRFQVKTNVKSFDITVPLDKAPSVKQNIKSYQLIVTRQLNEDLKWDYLEAKLQGSLGTFASTDKAPSLKTGAASSIALIPPNLSATVSFSEPSGNNILDAEETAQLQIEIKNSGKGSANMLEASFELNNAPGISFSRSLYFGEVKAGETIRKSLNLVAGGDTRNGRAELKISFKEQNGFPPNNVVLGFDTHALLMPDIYIADIGIEDFNRNNKIEPGEQVKVTVRVHNRGLGAARNLNASLLLSEGVFLFGDSPSSFNLGNMESGAYKDISFNIVSALTATKLDIKLDLKESRTQFSKMGQALNLAFNRMERTADQMVISGKATQQQVAQAPALSIDIEKDIPALAKADKNRWGVIIGIENYRNVSPVRFARRDAEVMKEYFVRVLGIKSENIYMALDDGASLGEFKSLFDARGWLSSNVRSADNEVFIYFSGHGVPAPDGKAAYL